MISTPAVADETNDTAPPTTAIDMVFERLLIDIVKGVHVAGARLPAERDLSKQLGTSRPTLREALRRLGEWNLVEPRRGSGVVVKPYRDWSIEVIPEYIRHGKPGPGQPTIARMVIDLFSLRRSMILEVLRYTVSRIPINASDASRAAVARAWSMRSNPKQFRREDFEVMRCIVESAGFVPGLWLLNRISQIWLNIADAVHFATAPHQDYVPALTSFFDLIDAGKANEAHDVIAAYLQRYDDAMVQALEMMT
jgi:DNA-binding FadR family transcriptional regulator